MRFGHFASIEVDLCKSVLNADNTVDKREVQIEEECLKALALNQPFAIDLRWLTTCSVEL